MALTVVQASPTVQVLAAAAPAADITATLGSPTAAGNTLVACINANGTTANPVATSATLGGSADHWAQVVANNPAVQSDAQIWFDPACVTAASVVVHFGTGGTGTVDTYLTVYEVAGVLTADKKVTADHSAATTFTSGATATTAVAEEIFFGALVSASSTLPVATGVGTWTTQGSAGGPRWQLAGYQIVAAVGTATYSGTQASGTYSVAAATFSVAGGVAVAPVYAPAWHPGGGLPGLPGGTPFAPWPQYTPTAVTVAAQDLLDAATTVTATATAALAVVKAGVTPVPAYPPAWFPAAPSAPGGEPFTPWPVWQGATPKSDPLNAALTVAATGAAALTEAKPLNAAVTVTAARVAALTEAKPLNAAQAVTAAATASLDVVKAGVTPIPAYPPAWFPAAPGVPGGEPFAPWPVWSGFGGTSRRSLLNAALAVTAARGCADRRQAGQRSTAAGLRRSPRAKQSTPR